MFPELVTGKTNSNITLAEAFVWKSLGFERFAISYFIDARQFFACCSRFYKWRRLQSLTLTASTLTQAAPKKRIYRLLCDAGKAALKMPQLERLALWNCKGKEACAVLYHRKKKGPCKMASLTWRGTWDLELSHDVVEAWQKVGSGAYYLRVANERVTGDINSHGDAIYHLRLPDGVIDPVSLRQIRQEGMMQRLA